MSLQALRGLDLNLLLVLHVLLETHSATAAAARLNLSQPAVSRALGRLRVLFGDKLFVKAARGLTPTPRGEALAGAVADLIAQIERTLDAPEFSPQASRQVFRLASTDYGALALLPQLSHQLQSQAPGLGLEIVPFGKDVFRRLSTGELDLVFYSDDPVPELLRTRKLFEESYAGLARPSHPALRSLTQGRMAMEAFLAHPHALVSVLGGRGGVVDEALDAIGLKRDVRLWLPYFATAALVASQRDLLLTVPQRVAHNLARSLELAAFELPIAIAPFGYQMVWHERTQADPAARWLRGLVAQVSKTI